VITHTTVQTSTPPVEPGADLQASAPAEAQAVPHIHAHDPSDTTKWYRASPQHLGRVGFITSMSRYCSVRVRVLDRVRC
jgi:hypothetical protein